MSIDFLLKRIEYVEELVFTYKFNEVVKNTVEIVEIIEKDFKFSKVENLKTWKEIMYYLTLALENKDYLLVVDILKYELSYILEKENPS